MGELFVLVFWLFDVADVTFMSVFDTTVPLNGLFWSLYSILWLILH